MTLSTNSILWSAGCRASKESWKREAEQSTCKHKDAVLGMQHLESAEMDNLSEWNSTRLKRILVDYMLRMSYYDTAMKLAESSNIQDLVDIDVFLEEKKVIDALQKKDVAAALA